MADSIVRQTSRLYDRIAVDFDDNRTTSQDFTALSHYVKAQDLVLDIGCGNGRLAVALRSSSINMIGLDGSAELVKIARKNNAEDIAVGWLGFVNFSMFDMPFDGHQFDVIFMMAVLHHTPSEHLRLQLLRHIHTISKAGATFIGSVWNLRGSVFQGRYGLAAELAAPRAGYDLGDVHVPWKTHGADESRYCHAFELDELRALFEKTGWRVIRLEGVDRNFNSAKLDDALNIFWELRAE